MDEFFQFSTITDTMPKIFLQKEVLEKRVFNQNEMLKSFIAGYEGMKVMGFDSKILLTKVVKLFLNFREMPKFLKSIVSDEKSFDIQNFVKALNLLSCKEEEKKGRVALMKMEKLDLEQFKDVIERLKKIIVEKEEHCKQMEQFASKIPKEFIDPIM